ncbi:MAG: nucleotide exchange factor GrpE [Candidatus Zixiibacteriota bacterium]|nr:MAG: nucleotide exchange factor GrpE [candidate division Zixibacteria bacterium]
MAESNGSEAKKDVPPKDDASGKEISRDNNEMETNAAINETSGSEVEDQPADQEKKAELRPDEVEESVEQVRADYEEKIKAQEDRFLRLAAEFDNYKKRVARQFDDILKNANEQIILEVLEVADNFERALEAASNSADFKSLHSGTELIYQHLLDVLDKEDVKSIKAVGEKFDPALHEAVMQAKSDDYPDGVIIQELTRGYKLKGRVIRFSKVVVSKGKPE